MMKSILIIAALFVASVASAESLSERRAGQLVEDMSREVAFAVRVGSVRQRADRLLPLVDQYVDIEYATENGLGPEIWNALTRSQRRDFMRIYAKLIAAQYALAFDGKGGERLRVTDTLELAGGQVRVKAIIAAGGAEIEVGFIVGGSREKRIRNLLLNGVAMLEQDRLLFTETWEAAGGSYRAFADAFAQ